LGLDHLAGGRPIEFAPTVKCAVEIGRGFRNHALQPCLAEPTGIGERRKIELQDAPGALAHLILPCFGKLNGGFRLRFHGQQLLVVGIDDLLDAFTQRQPHLGEPNRVKMRPHQRLVGDFESGRSHTARHHVGAALEKILVVAVYGTTVGEYQPRLSLASGATTALRIIGRRGGHIAHVDEVKVGDVHAKFHRG